MINDEIVIVATKNQGKVKEFARLLEKLNKQVRSLADVEHVPDIVEDANTFIENAEKKASIIAKHLNTTVIADDSGLCVDELNGAPGIYSARYAGEHGNDSLNNKKLLAELNKLSLEPNQNGCLSKAQFQCALALVNPASDEVIRVEASCEGWITNQPRGEHGFGYDPLFYLPQYEKTMAELDIEEKNKISHRANALKELYKVLNSNNG
ncbi:XTP/dITP diphosphatase [Chengkuizengella axinellae]|uniref:dITP/XTP pyrophosphatase n=1 Tax=Chengkuizengella axinellae TaxID=3064388 RepID=A0ABT9ITH7_9BACL|nr:XTP/dITP diphosphatase [Chengkuizengella sp. 2205SS18-9]MDP5272648.1 XTP/dITP diphosphatase [Chengkuizengella sp. 2205SS18-9]